VTVYRWAEVIVWEHDVKQHLTEAARSRFIQSLNDWGAIEAAGRPWAEAAAAHANLLVAHYWMALTRRRLRRFIRNRHRVDRRRPTPLRPAQVETHPVWTPPDALLMGFPTAEASAEAARTLRRALTIIAPSRRDEPNGNGSGNGRSRYGGSQPRQSQSGQSQPGQPESGQSESGGSGT